MPQILNSMLLREVRNHLPNYRVLQRSRLQYITQMLESMQIYNEILWGSDGIKILHSVWVHFWSFLFIIKIF